MDSGPTLKAKVTVNFTPKASPSQRPPSRHNTENSRPVSPAKSIVTAKLHTNTTPNFRPKAKVNSSATTRKAVATKPTSRSTSPSASPTPRSRSPTKLTRKRNGVTSTHTSKAPSYSGGNTTLRSPNVSAPVTPELRTRSLTTTSTASSSISPLEGGSSLHHALSFSSFQPKVVTQLDRDTESYGTASATSSPQLRPPAGAIGLDRDMTSSPTLRIRSKVSKVAKAADSSSGLSPPLAHPSTRSPNTNSTRTPSVSSVISQQPTSPPPQFYPITTATPAANPHRYPSVRPPPPPRTILPAASQVFQNVTQLPGSSAGGSPPSRNRFGVKVDGIQAKVDPSAVPPPPTSPPTSAVSFSSRSSVSRSSASLSAVDDVRSESRSTSTVSSNLSRQKNGGGIHHLTTTLDNLLQYASGLPSADDSAVTSGDDDKDEEHKVRAAAKSNRKIADLEITNRSLLAINATLETTKHRQAKEIHELKRRLRESRLILPPRAYRAFRSSEEPLEHHGDDDNNDDVGDDEQDDDEENENDDIYQRIKGLIDNLLKSGQRALEKQLQDFPEGGKGGAKVLTAEEVRDWHQSTHPSDLHDLDHERDDHHEEHHEELDNNDSIPLNAATSFEEQIGNDSLTVSEAEVESMTIPDDYPPIFITKPS